MSTEHLDLTPGVDRRVFVKGLGYVGMGVVLSLFGGCEKFCAQIKNRPVFHCMLADRQLGHPVPVLRA